MSYNSRTPLYTDVVHRERAAIRHGKGQPSQARRLRSALSAGPKRPWTRAAEGSEPPFGDGRAHVTDERAFSVTSTAQSASAVPITFAAAGCISSPAPRRAFWPRCVAAVGTRSSWNAKVPRSSPRARAPTSTSTPANISGPSFWPPHPRAFCEAMGAVVTPIWCMRVIRTTTSMTRMTTRWMVAGRRTKTRTLHAIGSPPRHEPCRPHHPRHARARAS